MRTHVSPSAGSTVVDRVKVYEGGTGQTAASLALAAMGAVPAALFNQPNGIAQLNASGKLSADLFSQNDAATVAVSGPSSVALSLTATYTITNFDVFTAYDITAVVGQVAREGDQITYFAPITAGAGGFVINGKTVSVTIDPVKPVTPVLASVSVVGTVASTAALIGNGSVFAMNVGVNSHLNTDWQVATDPAFTSIVQQSLADATNRTGWVSGNVNLSTLYYMRCRYRNSGNMVSDWSNTSTVTTKAVYVLNVEEAKLVANDGILNDEFGRIVVLDSTGTRVAVGAYVADITGLVDAGAVYIFVRSCATWTQEAKLTASDRTSNDWFGISISFDNTTTRIAVGARQADVSSVINTGAAYIFLRSGSTWTQEAKLIASDRLTQDIFGAGVDLDSTATRVIVSAYGADISAVVNAGAAYIFTRSGTTWTQEAKLTASDRADEDFFGTSAVMDNAGTRVAVGAYAANVSAVVDAGAVYIFTRSGTTWTQEAKLTASDRGANDFFGVDIDMDSAGTRVAVGAFLADVSGVINTGAAYIYVRSGTTWTQEAKLVAADRATDSVFGIRVSLDTNANSVVIGSHGDDSGGVTDTGAAYVFTRTGTSWTQNNKIVASDRAANDFFGYSLGMDSTGARVAVGAFQADISGVSNVGAIYIYRT